MKLKTFFIFTLAILLIAALIVLRRKSNPATGHTNFSKPPAASGEILAGSGSTNSKYGTLEKLLSHQPSSTKQRVILWRAAANGN